MAENEPVALPDLEVVRRYSLAVRAATAPRDEVIAALEADLAWLTAGRSRTAGRRGATAPEPAPGTGGRSRAADGRRSDATADGADAAPAPRRRATPGGATGSRRRRTPSAGEE